MSFRKEKKFRLSISDYDHLQFVLESKGMRKLHDTRIINSLYFDTPSLNMFHDSEEGLLHRKKIRIRWYDNNQIFFLEKKISSIEGRYKVVTPIEDSKTTKKSLYDENYGVLSPSLLISYKRSYFIFKKFRITFDSQITYKNIRNINPNEIEDPERVMEVKTGIGDSDDLIEKFIPYPISRFSKYSRGLLITNYDF